MPTKYRGPPMRLGNMRELGLENFCPLSQPRRRPRLLGRFFQRLVLAPDKPLQITAQYELCLVRQIVECGQDVYDAVPVPSDVIELLNVVHCLLALANYSCRLTSIISIRSAKPHCPFGLDAAHEQWIGSSGAV